jgi:hypothetical protein
MLCCFAIFIFLYILLSLDFTLSSNREKLLKKRNRQPLEFRKYY